MNIEQQVTSLELSKKLYGLGVKQDSLYYHHWYKKNREYEDIDHQILHERSDRFDDGKWKFECYSAFTASELLELLPTDYEIKKIKVTYNNGKSYSEYFIKHEDDGLDSSETFYDTNICNSLAKILIHLIENKLIEV